jgi:hypothetical protein
MEIPPEVFLLWKVVFSALVETLNDIVIAVETLYPSPEIPLIKRSFFR